MIKDIGPAPAQDTASLLLGLEGVTVTDAEEEADGRLAVWAVPGRCRARGAERFRKRFTST